MSSSRSDNSAYSTPFLDELRARTPLDGLAARHTTLKRSGTSLRGPCPIHGSSKTSDSFWVRHNRYGCFVCGARGDAISFAMWSDRTTFTEAVRRLAHDAGLDRTRRDQRRAAWRRRGTPPPRDRGTPGAA